MTRNTIIKYIRSARSRNRLTICSTRQYWWHNDEISDPVGSQYNEEISDPVLYHLWFDYERTPDEGFRRNVGIPMIWLYERIPDEGFRRNVGIPMIWLWAYTWWRASQRHWFSNHLTMRKTDECYYRNASCALN
jgi:hypothetical protein